MKFLLRSARCWLGGFLIWLSILFLLSASSAVNDISPPFQHFDKVAHFGYFFGGSGLLCAYLFRLNPAPPTAWKRLIVTAVLCIAVVGLLDEYHQTFTPGRSGNDPFDWLADILGGTAGAFVFKQIHHLLK